MKKDTIWGMLLHLGGNYAELKDGKISDLTRYIKFRNERKR